MQAPLSESKLHFSHLAPYDQKSPRIKDIQVNRHHDNRAEEICKNNIDNYRILDTQPFVTATNEQVCLIKQNI